MAYNLWRTVRGDVRVEAGLSAPAKVAPAAAE